MRGVLSVIRILQTMLLHFLFWFNKQDCAWNCSDFGIGAQTGDDGQKARERKQFAPFGLAIAIWVCAAMAQANMWFFESMIVLTCYTLWAILHKLSSDAGVTALESQLIQLPVRLILTLYALKDSWTAVRILELPVKGTIYSVLTCVSTTISSFYYGRALASGASGATVAAISGQYPAFAYALGICIGIEEVSPYKILGLFFACCSCICFCL